MALSSSGSEGGQSIAADSGPRQDASGRVTSASQELVSWGNKDMGKKIFTKVEGNTLGSHEKFLKKLRKRGARIVDHEAEGEATVLFCPIVSRFETDISAALSSLSSFSENKKPLILVAMHHTFNENYPLPERETLAEHPEVDLVVDCLFFEKKGLLDCPRNKKAKKRVCKELKLSKTFPKVKLK